VLSICGTAGSEPALGDLNIERKSAQTCIIATLGILNPIPNMLFVNASDGSKTSFDLVTNTSWTAVSDQDWLTVSSASGSGNTTLSFTATENTSGAARVAIVTITFDGKKSSGIKITIIQAVSTVGLDDLTLNRLILYPNPAHDFIYLPAAQSKSLVFVYDQHGRLLLKFENPGNRIDISSLQQGVYTMQISDKQGVIVRKFVKQ
jgi:hypothetical protein